ncbi:hypothetical protein HY310_02010 [Candidatus Microgenomates bacterium]|nr:hypothetical protein [Candidatus Microgenomates bacterium]
MIGWIHLPIIAILVYAARQVNAKKIYVLAFTSGLFADLVLGNSLGVLAVSYLLASLVVTLFKSKYSFNPFLIALFIFVSELIFFYAKGFIR